MGYACPVCSDPQADAGHLANHLAFTAILGDDDHEAWLDDHEPGWDELGEAELADALVDELEATEFPQLFEDTAGGLQRGSGEAPGERSGALFDSAHEHGHEQSHSHGDATDAAEPLDDEAAEILEAARELTRQMHDDDGDSGDDE